MAMFRIGIISWLGMMVSVIFVVTLACILLELLSFKMEFLRVIQLEPQRGGIQQGNMGVLDIK